MTTDPRIPVRSHDGAANTKRTREMPHPMRRYHLLPPNEHEALMSKRSPSDTPSSRRRAQLKYRPTVMLGTSSRSPAQANMMTAPTQPPTRKFQSRSYPGYDVTIREHMISPSAASEQRSSNSACSSSTLRFDHSMGIPPPFRAKSNVKGRWQRMRSKVSNGVVHVVTTFYR